MQGAQKCPELYSQLILPDLKVNNLSFDNVTIELNPCCYEHVARVNYVSSSNTELNLH